MSEEGELRGQAGKVLKAAKDAEDINQQRAKLKEEMRTLYRESRNRQRKITAPQKKAARIDLTDLMQMLMMKAYVHNVRHEREQSTSSSAASSSSTWVPRDGVEALDRLRMLAASCQDPEVVEFAKSMRLQEEAEKDAPTQM